MHCMFRFAFRGGILQQAAMRLAALRPSPLPVGDEFLPSLDIAEEEVEEKVINEQYKTWRVNSR